jgi:hypothetical protein
MTAGVTGVVSERTFGTAAGAATGTARLGAALNRLESGVAWKGAAMVMPGNADWRGRAAPVHDADIPETEGAPMRTAPALPLMALFAAGTARTTDAPAAYAGMPGARSTRTEAMRDAVNFFIAEMISAGAWPALGSKGPRPRCYWA